ncbi:MAG: ABC transporter substrate-binding protein [Xanthobacteraceae bacterium]
MNVSRREFLAAGAASLALPPSLALAAGETDWDRIEAAAKQEGELVFTSSLQSKVVDTVLKNFETKTGIRVGSIRGRPSEVRERVRAAHIAGKQSFDIVYGSEALTTIRYNEDKTVLDIPPVMRESIARTTFKTAAPLIPVMTITYGFLVNANLVKPDDEPKGWYDLLDPKWSGKILLDDPRTNGPGHIFFTGTFGPDFHKKLAAQKPTLTRETQESYRRVARGEYPLFVGFTLPDITSLAGLPVRAVLPKEGSPYVLYGTTFIPNAPHPNAALMFARYNSSDDALLAYGNAGFGVGVPSVVARLPDGVRQIAEVKLLGTTDPAGQDGAFALARDIYGR